jgi:hypothetical protein
VEFSRGWMGMNNRTFLNKKANIELKKLFEQKDIKTCELRFTGCMNNYYLNFCHRHKRKWYYDKPDELLWDFSQVVLGCQQCHELIEGSKELTEIMFKKLRGVENG